ncbi:PAS domain S-box protein [Salinibacter grassmerensis]|uniref:PAS domain S-box protein n=1 Tax=Salinibacter grassmerensis TaxID=3040353 RepID=UPI0021E72447|nr:PAS domain S-box protein [Salinibacter grassmerensis]
MHIPPPALALLRPLGGDLSPATETTVQLHRLLCLLSTVLVLALGALYDATSLSGSINPAGARLGVAGLFVGLFGASYASAWVRRRFPQCLRGVLYVFLVWFAVVAGLNGFAGDYDMGFLLVYAILPGMVAIGSRGIGPVLWFLGLGMLLGAVSAGLGPASMTKTGAVLASLTAVALVEGIAIQTHLSTQNQLRGFAHSIPGVAFQGYTRPEDSHGTYFVSDHAESLLGLPADPDVFHDRFIEQIPSSHREGFRASLAEAAATRTPWQQEVPFDTPSGERLWLLCAATPAGQGGGGTFNGVILDITEQKRAERALRDERDRFETLFESLPTPVVRCTIEEDGAHIADTNGAFEKVFGIDAAAAEGQKAADLLLSGEDVAEADTLNGIQTDRSTLGAKSLRTEVHRTVEEGPRDFQLQAAGRAPADGPPELYAIYTDITEEKEYERELEKLTTRLQLALEATDMGFWEWNLDADTIFWDEACEQLFGYEPGTFPGTYEAFTDQVHPADLEAVEQHVQQALETDERYQADFRVPQRDGTERWIQSRGTVEYGADGAPQRMRGIHTDITDRKRREQDLRRKERRYQAIFGDPNILAGLLNPDGTFLAVNDTAMGYIEASRDEVLGELFWETPWWAEDMQRTIRQKIERAADGEYAQFEAEHTHPDDDMRMVTGNIRPVTDRSGRVVSLVVSARDVTERKKRAEELRAAKEEAEDANQMKSAFLANMSHEIRTPLTSIIGFAEAIGNEVDADAEGPVPHFAGLIEKSGRHLLDTLNAVLNLSKLEAGEMALRPEAFDLADQVEEMVSQLHPQAEEASVNLHADTSAAPVRADEGGTQVALRNLVSNAIKYTPEGGHVKVRARTSDDAAVLEVEDTGIGMNPDQVPTLFEPFRQASEGTSREYEGTGLGLSVTKRIVDQMNGDIAVDTAVGEGTCFTIRLPNLGAPPAPREADVAN